MLIKKHVHGNRRKGGNRIRQTYNTPKKRTIKLLKFIGVSIIIMILFLYWQNNHIIVSKYIYKDQAVSETFDGFTIVQISDLHNKEFGKQLSRKIKKQKADIIVITGDLVDSRRTNIDISLNAVKEMVKLAPVYYIVGNHESRIKEYAILEEGLIDLGVIILKDSYIDINREGSKIRLLGVLDPSFFGMTSSNIRFQDKMVTWVNGNLIEGVSILLSHRPEIMSTYDRTNVNLVLSGHAHGGQVRFPFLGGLIAPEQGVFPLFDAGKYTGNNTTMVVSRGLGNSIIPFRIFNRPDLVVVTLRSEKN